MSKMPQKINELEINESADGYVIYDPNNNKVHFLNHTAVVILELCNGRNSEEKIVQLIGKAYQLKEIPEKEILSIMKKLNEEGLIQ